MVRPVLLRRKPNRWRAACALLALACGLTSGPAGAEWPAGSPPGRPNPGAVVAPPSAYGSRSSDPLRPNNGPLRLNAPLRPNAPPRTIDPQRPKEHPVTPALRWAQAAAARMAAIQDYSGTFVQRERIDGVLGTYKSLRLKIRHRPFSVYAYFDAPQDVRGQEVIYVAGANNGKLLAHGVGIKALAGTLSLDPRGTIAMQGSRHPVTEIGLLNFAHRMIGVLESDARDPQYQVKYLPGTKIHGRSCTCMQFVHPAPGPGIPYYMARVYVDDELNVPVRGETYLWPTQRGGEPVLIQEYTYLNLRINNGFTDRDFDVNNPQYGFRR